MEMSMFLHFFFSFIATAAFGVLFQAPKRTLAMCGLVGAIGWCIYKYLGTNLEYSSFYANFAATVALSVFAELFARVAKEPATIFIATGVIPLVPGLGLYKGMNMIIGSNYDQGVTILITAATDSMAIALGVMMVASILRVLHVRKLKKLI
ncbi:MAG: threonine/serine exporter family protein [Phascolarctobacterium sp.]|nr:threonine/serine exporter family protein [Phascolarctobacterium sp.]